MVRRGKPTAAETSKMPHGGHGPRGTFTAIRSSNPTARRAPLDLAHGRHDAERRNEGRVHPLGQAHGGHGHRAGRGARPACHRQGVRRSTLLTAAQRRCRAYEGGRAPLEDAPRRPWPTGDVHGDPLEQPHGKACAARPCPRPPRCRAAQRRKGASPRASPRRPWPPGRKRRSTCLPPARRAPLDLAHGRPASMQGLRGGTCSPRRCPTAAMAHGGRSRRSATPTIHAGISPSLCLASPWHCCASTRNPFVSRRTPFVSTHLPTWPCSKTLHPWTSRRTFPWYGRAIETPCFVGFRNGL
jgi:hypothetical protein